VGHPRDRVRGRAGRAADANVVERDDAAPGGEIVDQRRIPVVEIAAEVLQQDERNVAGSELAVGVIDPLSAATRLMAAFA
jgi:hypothetical protein